MRRFRIARDTIITRCPGVRRSRIALAAVLALGAGEACVSDPGGNGSGGNPGNAGTPGGVCPA